jgi:hypothetical protein
MSVRVIRNRYGEVEALVAANEPRGVTLNPLHQANKQVTQVETHDVDGLKGEKLISKLRELRKAHIKE